ncbi:type II toxin-antitoxin system VapC family toxin [Roseateles sp. LYH14W]|uniref:Type II toxin-antitoxin system VapC family toxin n=1 Tax=Pelomonas parva TaxID=3299032 RepID=A0ABW7F6M4_9BURK
MILVDTCVWSEHFKQPDPALVGLLQLRQVLSHELVIGELACGTPPAPRAIVLAEIARLPRAATATVTEAIQLLDREKFFGCGLGLIDVLLLASTLITPGATLYTLDKRRDAAARQLGVAYGHSAH